MFTRNFVFVPVRSAAILTTSYVAGTVISEATNYNQLTILVDYTIGSLTSLEIIVEYSFDDVTYYQDVNIGTSAGTNTITVANYTYTGTSDTFSIQTPISASFIKISAKGSGGTPTGSSLKLDALLAYVG